MISPGEAYLNSLVFSSRLAPVIIKAEHNIISITLLKLGLIIILAFGVTVGLYRHGDMHTGLLHISEYELCSMFQTDKLQSCELTNIFWA